MLPTSELHRHFMTEFQPKFRSIIITDMPHRPTQLLYILSGFYRYTPLPEGIIFIPLRSLLNRSKQAYHGAPT